MLHCAHWFWLQCLSMLFAVHLLYTIFCSSFSTHLGSRQTNNHSTRLEHLKFLGVIGFCFSHSYHPYQDGLEVCKLSYASSFLFSSFPWPGFSQNPFKVPKLHWNSRRELESRCYTPFLSLRPHGFGLLVVLWVCLVHTAWMWVQKKK